MIYCTICGMKFLKQSYLLSHIRLKHQYKANFKIGCTMGCGKTFTVLSSYTSHLAKVHSKVSNKGYKAASLCCSYCTHTCKNLSELISHFDGHMKTGLSVECPIENCLKSYHIKSSLSAHIYKYHCLNKSIKKNLLIKWPQFSDSEDSPSDNAIELPINDSTVSGDIEVPSESFENNEWQFALFFLKLQAKYHVSSSTTTVISEGFKDLMNLQRSLWVKNLQNNLNTVTDPVTKKFIESTVDTSFMNTDILSHMNTSHNRLAYYSKHFKYIKPVRYALGRNQYHVECSFQYIPIIETLRTLLQHNDIKNQLCQERNTIDGIFNDFSDGAFFKKNIYLNSQSSSKSLALLLYFDEFSIVNPIGAQRKNHKIASFYYTLGNLDLHHRSSLNLIHLSILCRNKDLKYFGLKAILYPLIRDLKTLRHEGIFVPGFGHLTAGVSFVCGDNLGSHFLGGFMECFSPNVSHVCRTCMIPSSEIQTNFDVASFHMRTPQMYNDQANAVELGTSPSSEFGIKMNSPLNEIPDFHVITGLPPDAMHDILEGVLGYEVSLILKKLIEDGHFTLDFLNRPIKSLSYGKHDSLSKPIEQDLKQNTLVGTAASNWCFLRLLPILIGFKVPKDNKYWQLLLHLKMIVETIFAPVISIGHVDSLQSDIILHLKTFKDLFPSNPLKPKHHFLIHYPVHILNFGPPIRYWCFRFEAKHRFFKEVARYTKQFKNPPFTLANSHQLYQCYCHQSDQGFLKSQFECPGSESLCFVDITATAFEALQKLNVPLGELFQAKVVTIKGLTYALQMFVVIDFNSNGDIVFGEIVKILIHKEKVWFMVKKYESEKLLHFGCYKLLPLMTYDCMEQCTFLDYYPLSAYNIENDYCKVISLKHFVFNQIDYLK